MKKRRITRSGASSNCLTNVEIVTLAVYLLGGKTKSIDTEHIAVRAAQLAPGRYNWRYYPNQINIHIIGAFLADAKKSKNGSYLKGSINEGWRLTEAGGLFADENASRLEDSDLTGTRKSVGEKKWFNRERSRLLASDAFAKYQNGGRVSVREAASFFRIDEYVLGDARERKVTRIVNAFRHDAELGTAILVFKDLVLNEEVKPS